MNIFSHGARGSAFGQNIFLLFWWFEQIKEALVMGQGVQFFGQNILLFFDDSNRFEEFFFTFEYFWAFLVGETGVKLQFFDKNIVSYFLMIPTDL